MITGTDMVNHPPHYNEHPSGVEAITITEHFNFCLGNAIKYIWRADSKGKDIEDLEKAAWYLQREIERRKNFCEHGRGITDYCEPCGRINSA